MLGSMVLMASQAPRRMAAGSPPSASARWARLMMQRQRCLCIINRAHLALAEGGEPAAILRGACEAINTIDPSIDAASYIPGLVSTVAAALRGERLIHGEWPSSLPAPHG